MKPSYSVAPLHSREDLRLAYLKSLKILDTPEDIRFEQIVGLIKQIFDVEIATITLVDENRQWFLSQKGLQDVCQTDRDVSFCSHTILQDEYLKVDDATSDERFKNNPLVLGNPNIRSYLGIIIWSADDTLPIGSLCAIDTRVRNWNDDDINIMKRLARLVEGLLHSNTHQEIERNKLLLESNIDISLNCLDENGFATVLNNEISKRNHSELVDNLMILRMQKAESIQFKYGKNAIDKILLSIIDMVLTQNSGLNLIIGRLDRVSIGFLFYDTCSQQAAQLFNKISTETALSLPIGNIEIDVALRSIFITDLNYFQDYEDLLFTINNIYKQSPLSKVHYDHSPDLEAVKRKSLVRLAIKSTLGTNALEMHYQPKVSLTGGTVEGFEALVRWHDKALGFVSPLDILECVDVLNLEFKFIAWTINRVMQDMEEWREQGLTLLPVSINLTESVLLLPELYELTKDLLKNHKISAELIEYEILESSLFENLSLVTDNISRLKELGIKVSIDDFGTGYSALRLLSELPIDRIKIDKSFIDNVAEDPKATDLVDAIINLSQGYGFDLVAEGVETRDQVLVLRVLGCEYAQGYYFSKPLSKTQAIDILKTPHY